MNNMPIVSVLIASYNAQEFISQAIESVLNQTFCNFELIISDDCSTDKTLLIARGYQDSDPRIRIFVNERNLGDYPNRNKAASYAIGKYIKYLDHDDIMYSHCLAVMVESMQKYPNAAFGIQSFKREDVVPYPILIDGDLAIREHYLQGGLLLPGPTGAIINKFHFDKIGGFSGKRFLGDTELWLRLSSEYPVIKFQPALVWWRVHETQESRKQQKSYSTVLARYLLDKYYILNSCDCFSSVEKKWLFKKLNRRLLENTIMMTIKMRSFSILRQFLTIRLSFFDLFFAIFHF